MSQMSIEPGYLEWQAALGPALTRFLLSIDGEPPEKLSEEQRAALVRLSEEEDNLRAADARIAVALVRARDGDLALGWALRQGTGGRVPEPIGDTPAERLLSQIARDCYPILLSPEDATLPMGSWASLPAASPSIGLAHVVDSHALVPALREALADRVGRSDGALLVSALGVTPVVEAFDPEHLLSAARRRLRHDERSSPASFMGHAVACLHELVLAAGGTGCPVRALIGLSGMPTIDAPLGPLGRSNLHG